MSKRHCSIVLDAVARVIDGRQCRYANLSSGQGLYCLCGRRNKSENLWLFQAGGIETFRGKPTAEGVLTLSLS